MSTKLTVRLFDWLTKVTPASERCEWMPAGPVKRVMQQLGYWIDWFWMRFFLIILAILLPLMFVLSLYVTWQTIKTIFSI